MGKMMIEMPVMMNVTHLQFVVLFFFRQTNDKRVKETGIPRQENQWQSIKDKLQVG